jgi:hypothetical protein
VPGDVLALRSRPDLSPAAVEITKPAAGAGGGDIFVAPQQGPDQSGPMILDPSGNLVWFQAMPKGDISADFRVQQYRGKPALTWWQGYLGAGVGVGEDVIEDASYRRIATVRAANGLAADLHEFRLTPQGTALITAYYPVYWDASSVHGSTRQVVLDSVVQEIDVKTGLLLFQWDSLDHTPLSDSYQPKPVNAGQPFDYFHVNSVQSDPQGTLIISARNTWAGYKVSRETGQVEWTVGGKRSTFKLSAQSQFAFQHDIRVRSEDGRTITVFDDGAGPPTVHRQSRGLTIKLDPKRRTATVDRSVTHSPQVLANYEGNLQELAGGDQFIGWGQQPYFTEFDRRGQIVFDGRFIGGNSSYRAYRFAWAGTPRTRPAITAAGSGQTTTVYVSWNGATSVASWRVLAGSDAAHLHPVLTAPKRSFESQVTAPAAAYLCVQALDGQGRVLGTSETVRPAPTGA